MRFEESDGELRIITPGAERDYTRAVLLIIGGLFGAFSTFLFFEAWSDSAAQSRAPGVSLGIVASLLSAWALWGVMHLGDDVWRINFDYEQRAVLRQGDIVARFDEVLAVRYNTDNQSHGLVLVLKSGRYCWDVSLHSTLGTAADSEVFEQAASRIAEILGVRFENRRRPSKRPRGIGLKQNL
jgi:hypothetical protein